MVDMNLTQEQRRGLILVFTLSIGISAFYFLNSRPQPATQAVDVVTPLINQVEQSKLIINVAGKVKSPGVYQLPPGSRVIDAIEAAGNHLKGVDISDINLARLLVDGEQILVGGNRLQSSKSVARKITVDNPLDINRATLAQLDTLPGIGPVTAQRIIDYRNKVGRINALDELKKISGLGGAKFEEIKSLLRVM
jgi:competence protein ComEA